MESVPSGSKVRRDTGQHSTSTTTSLERQPSNKPLQRTGASVAALPRAPAAERQYRWTDGARGWTDRDDRPGNAPQERRDDRLLGAIRLVGGIPLRQAARGAERFVH